MPLLHGTRSGYTYYKCRCEDCTLAQREYDTARRRARGQKTMKEISEAAQAKKKKPVTDRVAPKKGSRVTQEQLDRALYHLQDGCSYLETARTVGVGQQTLMQYFPGYKGQGRLNMVEINGNPELKALHDEIWNMKL